MLVVEVVVVVVMVVVSAVVVVVVVVVGPGGPPFTAGVQDSRARRRVTVRVPNWSVHQRVGRRRGRAPDLVAQPVARVGGRQHAGIQGGCSYSSYALSFDDNAKGNKSCGWPTECQTDPKWERLAPSITRRPDQINEPLGMDRANRLAGLLGMDKSMILTDQEYECTIGIPPRDDARKTIFACVNNLTNSNGSTNIPLSSYGLAITDDRNADVPVGDVQSLCAPSAPCLVFNDLFLGPLERIAAVCGWEMKLERMVRETPFREFAEDGSRCQEFGGTKDGGPCIVKSVCPSGRPGS